MFQLSTGGVRIKKENKVEYFLPKVIINFFYEDNKNGLWIGTDSWGVYYFYEGIIKTYSGKNGLSDFITAIKKQGKNKIYAASNFRKKLFLGEKGYFKEIKNLKGNSFTSMEVQDNFLWIGTENGLIKYRQGKIKKKIHKKGRFKWKFHTIIVS